jgi:hypothetical protein
MLAAMKAHDILPEGVDTLERNGRVLRKGSVAAFIANAKLLDAADTPADARRTAEADLRELVPVLVEVGVFDVFEVRSPRIRALVEAARSA